MNTDDSSKLIERYFLGTISETEMECLDAQLQSDTAFREAFAAMARLDTNLRETALQLGNETEQPYRRVSLAKDPLWVGLAAATAVVLGTWLFLWSQSNGLDHFARIVEVGGGSLRWTGDGGEVTDTLTKGLSLSGGTLESLSANSWVEIAFGDGSRMSLFGQSVMTISRSDEGKIIRLREGSLSAEVAPVHERKPMRFFTPTAEAEVLGTQFTLRADSSSTRLIVYEGSVRATRLADGSSQDVPADHFVVAAADTAESFLVLPREHYVDSWRSTLPYGMGHGEWHPGVDGAEGYLEAKPLLWKEYGKHMVLDLASMSAAGRDQPTSLLNDGAHIRMVGRVAHDCEVHFGLTTHRVGGGFAGKYIASQRLAGSEDHFELDLPITSFKRQYSCFPESLVGHELVDWWALTINQEAGLEIISVELSAP